MNRVLLYVHFNSNGELSEHVVYQLRNIQPLFNRVVFITNSKLSAQDKRRLTDLFDSFIQRENVGFDFAAWRDGINYVGWDELVKFDSLTIMNDTCFGPIYPIGKMYEKMEKENIDFWGITDHAANSIGMPGTGGPVPRHVQSYMEVFNSKVIKSDVFQSFWENIKDHSDVIKVIQEYETKLTDVLHDTGFSYDVFFNTGDYTTKYNIVDTFNYAELLPIVMLKNGVPLLKIKSFLRIHRRKLLNMVKQTDYPTGLIVDHLEAMHIVNTLTWKFYFRRGLSKCARPLTRTSAYKRVVRRKPKE
ncbi:MAG TPA: rhamnan synthesis F family protein [Candidatus Saccharimonadales bacterium]